MPSKSHTYYAPVKVTNDRCQSDLAVLFQGRHWRLRGDCYEYLTDVDSREVELIARVQERMGTERQLKILDIISLSE